MQETMRPPISHVGRIINTIVLVISSCEVVNAHIHEQPKTNRSWGENLIFINIISCNLYNT